MSVMTKLRRGKFLNVGILSAGLAAGTAAGFSLKDDAPDCPVPVTGEIVHYLHDAEHLRNEIALNQPTTYQHYQITMLAKDLERAYSKLNCSTTVASLIPHVLAPWKQNSPPDSTASQYALVHQLSKLETKCGMAGN